MIKQLLKTGLKVIGLLGLVTCIYIGYVFSPFNEDIDKEKIVELTEVIKESKKHDERLLLMYSKVNNNALEKSFWDNYWRMILKGENNRCPCWLVVRDARFINLRKRIVENDFAITVKIEKEVSQKDCLNYYLENFRFLNRVRGIETAAKFYFQKEIANLSEDEMIGLIVMLENPVLYNPKRFKERHDEKVKEVKKKFFENNSTIF